MCTCSAPADVLLPPGVANPDPPVAPVITDACVTLWHTVDGPAACVGHHIQALTVTVPFMTEVGKSEKGQEQACVHAI